MTLVLQPPDVAVIARSTMAPQLADRGHDIPWYIGEVPATRPVDERFVVVEVLNTRQTDVFSADMMTQFRIYHPDPRLCLTIAKLISALADALPAGFEIQDTEHIGGPTEQSDPDVPGARRYLVTKWLSAMCEPA